MQVNLDTLDIEFVPEAKDMAIELKQQMDIITKELEQPRIKPTKPANKKKQPKKAEPQQMPLMERYKLENDAVCLFESTVEQCTTDKDDYIQELCDQLCIEQRRPPTSGQNYRRLIQKGLSKTQAEGMAHLIKSAESPAQKQ
jgi:hypothetical protein